MQPAFLNQNPPMSAWVSAQLWRYLPTVRLSNRRPRPSHLPNHPPGRVRAPLWRHRTAIEDRPAHQGGLHREWKKAVLSALTRITSSHRLRLESFAWWGTPQAPRAMGHICPVAHFPTTLGGWALGRAKPSATHGLGETDFGKPKTAPLCIFVSCYL